MQCVFIAATLEWLQKYMIIYQYMEKESIEMDILADLRRIRTDKEVVEIYEK